MQSKNSSSASAKVPKPLLVLLLALAIGLGAWFFFASPPVPKPAPVSAPPGTTGGGGTSSDEPMKQAADSQKRVHETAVKSLAQFKEFRKGNFAIKYPASWETADEKIASAQIFRVHTLNGLANVGITAHTLQANNLEAWTKSIIDGLKKVMGPGASLTGVKPINIPGGKANMIVYEAQPENVPMRAKQVLVLAMHGDVGYTVACTAPVAYYQEFEPVFEKIIASIRFDSAAAYEKPKAP